jgi:hypothetical protein
MQLYIHSTNSNQMKTSRLLIDSRARISGNVSNFVIQLKPTYENISAVSLLWADIPNPSATPSGPFFEIKIAELGTTTRMTGTSEESTFIVPVTVNVNERVFYSALTSFEQTITYEPPRSLQSLSIVITRPLGAAPLTDESVMILQLEHHV